MSDNDSMYLRISDIDDDDFVHDVYTVTASSCGTTVKWKLPKRLLQNRPEIHDYLLDEMRAELIDRINAKAARRGA